MNVLPVLHALSMSSVAAAGGNATNFTGYDWGIVALYLIASIAVGVYANKFISKLSDYLVAGRGLGIYLAVATMTGTELGLITVMYSAQKGFTGGFAAFHIALAAGIVTFFVGNDATRFGKS